MKFAILGPIGRPPKEGRNTAHLISDNWNDYSFVTAFHLYVHDDSGNLHDISHVKIAFKGQTTATASYGYLEIYEICLPLITIKKCLSASSQQIISAQAMQYCRQIDSYWILLRQ